MEVIHIVLLSIFFILLYSFAYAAVSGAPWVPTKRADIDRLDRLLDLKPGTRFYELGCGDGRVCLSLAKRKHVKITGIELSLLQWIAAMLGKYFTRSWNVTFKLGNIFNQDLSQAHVVYLFMMPGTYARIRDKFERELIPGARVVSYVWPIPDWKPTKVDKMQNAPDLFLYEIG